MKCLSSCSKSALSWNAQERKDLRAGRKPKGSCLKLPGWYGLCFMLFLLNHIDIGSTLYHIFLTWSIDLSCIKLISVQFKARENSIFKEKREVEERLEKEKAFLEKRTSRYSMNCRKQMSKGQNWRISFSKRILCWNNSNSCKESCSARKKML